MWIYTDIIVHSKYVLGVQSECYDQNKSDYCNKVRQDLQVTSQSQIPNAYYGVLLLHAFGTAGLMIFIRLGLSYFAKGGIKYIKAMDVYVALLWGVTISLFFMSGFLDWGYYWGKQIPDKLEWLNDSGIFQYTKALGSDPINVERSDLFVTMYIGIGILLLIWTPAMHKYHKNRNLMQEIGLK